MQGYRTYATIAVLLVKKGLDLLDISIPEKELSDAVDVGLAILAGVFRWMAKGK